MKKQISMVIGVMAALCGSALAADTSTTILMRDNATPLGITPRMGAVRAQANAAAVSAGAFTYDLNVPAGKTPTCITNVRDVSGSLKLAGVRISNSVVTVSNSIATSGTLVVSDTATTLCVYND